MQMIFETPLEKVVGFHVSEQTYDRLALTEQVVVDLKIEGFPNTEIAALLGCRPTDINRILRMIQHKLAKSELRFHLDVKTYMQSQKEIVLDETELVDFGMQNLFAQPLTRRNHESETD